MKYDNERIDDAVLALLAAFSFEYGQTWKGFDFGVMDRLHELGFISQPKGRNKSVYLSEEGLERGLKLAEELFKSAEAVE